MSYLKNTIAETLVLIIIIVPWLKGIALATGFWQTLFSLIPIYAWYLVIDHFWV